MADPAPRPGGRTTGAASREAGEEWRAPYRAPAVSLPKGGGAIRGIGEKFAVSPATGTATLSVPISTSPGRNGFGPALSLTYDCGSGNSAFGLGWTLALAAITRKTDEGLPRYRDGAPPESDTFVLSGAEDLVPVMMEVGDGFQPAGTSTDAAGPVTLDRSAVSAARRGPVRPDRTLDAARRWRRALAVDLARRRHDDVRHDGGEQDRRPE